MHFVKIRSCYINIDQVSRVVFTGKSTAELTLTTVSSDCVDDNVVKQSSDLSVPRRTPKLDGEHIIETAYTLPPHWRMCEGREWLAGYTAYLAFCLRADLETDAYLKIEDCVNACWELERKRIQ